MGSKCEGIDFSYDEQHLRIQWANGHASTYDAMWLRDNCPENRDPRTGQRLADIADLPEHPALGHVSHDGTGALLVTWSGERKTSRLQIQWLREHCYCRAHGNEGVPEPDIWAGDRSGELKWLDYAGVRSSGRARHDWLQAIASQGIAFLRGVPPEGGRVLEVAKLIGFVTETNYGRVFNVRSVPEPNNLAYTDLSLGLHTDNPYRDPVPGYQMLHCLQAAQTGGESVFADGFAVATDLGSLQPHAFDLLTTTPVRFSFRDADHEFSAERPLIQLGHTGELKAVHYNNRSIAPLHLSGHKMAAFYRAYRIFAELLRDPRYEYRVTLRPGDLATFDNHRVLHGRTRFSSSDGQRHLQGCYLNRDGLLSSLKILGRQLDREQA